MVPTRILLDTCVLYPPSVRDLLLRLAAEDAFQVRVSEGILDELETVLQRNAGLTGEAAAARAAGVRAVADSLGALVPLTRTDMTIGAGIGLPDEGDAHLVDSALSGDCDAIATFNLRDLPEGALETVGLEAWNPDWLLEEMARDRHPALLRVVGDLVTVVPRYESVSDVALTINAAGLPLTGGRILTAAFAAAVETYDPSAGSA